MACILYVFRDWPPGTGRCPADTSSEARSGVPPTGPYSFAGNAPVIWLPILASFLSLRRRKYRKIP